MHSLKPLVQAWVFFQLLQGFFHDSGGSGIWRQLNANAIFLYPVGEIRSEKPELAAAALPLQQNAFHRFFSGIKAFDGSAIPKRMRFGWEIDPKTAFRIICVAKSFAGDTNGVQG